MLLAHHRGVAVSVLAYMSMCLSLVSTLHLQDMVLNLSGA